MVLVTIHCDLVASELVRHHLWTLMAEQNTPLINELLKEVSQHPEFEAWQQQGSIPPKAVKDLCKRLRVDFPGQPGRFYQSADLMVTYAYESWLATEQQLRRRLDGKRRWLRIVKSDAELIDISQSSLDRIRCQARQVLARLDADTTVKSNKDLMGRLFDAYEKADDSLVQCAIAYLLKNGGTLPEINEDPDNFAHRLRRKQIQIERLEARLIARLPKGRDLTGQEFIETLAIATQQIPESVIQFQEWQARLRRQPTSLPYPIIFGGSSDLRWSKTADGRLTVNFKGIEKYLREIDPNHKDALKKTQEFPFKIYCDRRQLSIFERFYKDWQAYRTDSDTYPEGLMTLRSATLAWREECKNDSPWNANRLSLHCTYDTRLMSAEGTADIQQQKLIRATQILSGKPPDDQLTPQQESFYKRMTSRVSRLQYAPARPSENRYHGNPDILLGLSLGLSEPVTVAVVNGPSGKTLTYRNTRTLLKENYRLLRRKRQLQAQNARQRHKNNIRGVAHQPSESELGKHVDYLLAKAIVELAKVYHTGSIVLPNLKYYQDSIASDLKARAQKKCPGSIEAQKAYTKQVQINLQKWSYCRLIESVSMKARKAGIVIETGLQPARGKLYAQASNIALTAYEVRKTTTKQMW